MIYFTSDNHFYHENVLKYSERPWANNAEMNTGMRKLWNQTVTPQDTVWLLGDVGFAKLSTMIELLESLNGKKHLVYGNHDKVLRKGSKELLERGVFQSMQDYKELKHGGRLYVLCHFAMRTWNKAQYDSVHLFGHTHGYLKPRGRSVDVGIDDKNITTEYRPVSILEVDEFMRDRARHTNHHDHLED